MGGGLAFMEGMGGGSGNEGRVVGAGETGWGRGKGACAGLLTVMVLPGFPGLLSGSLLRALDDVPVRGEEASWAEGTGTLCCTQS